MAKRIFKTERLKQIVKNIAEDFRFSHETDEYALLFYEADTKGEVRGAQIEQMIEYLETGIKELENTIGWRQEFLEQNPRADEIAMMENLKTIEEEYRDLLGFLKNDNFNQESGIKILQRKRRSVQ